MMKVSNEKKGSGGTAHPKSEPNFVFVAVGVLVLFAVLLMMTARGPRDGSVSLPQVVVESH